jgi:hypothetical protein
MQSKVCRTSPTLKQSKDQRFERVGIMRKRTADPRAAYGAMQADLLPTNIWCVYTRGIALVSDCSRNSDVRCSTQSFAPTHKIQEVATTHIFLRNDGNNLLTHKLEET